MTLAMVALLIQSCRAPMVGYVTSTHNMPLLKDTGDMHMFGTIGTNHLEFQAAYSPIKHIGLMANSYSGLPGLSGELGAGYYFQPFKGVLVEAYGLLVASNLSRRNIDTYQLFSQNIDAEIQEIHAKYKGGSLQADIAFFLDGLNHQFAQSFAVGAKFSRVHYSHFSYENWYYTRWEDQWQSLSRHYVQNLDQSNLNFLSISGTYRIGDELTQLMFQYSHHMNLNGYEASKNEAPYFSKVWVTVGIEFNFNVRQGRSRSSSLN